MMLVDTGALYALADRRDSHHGQAANFFRLALCEQHRIGTVFTYDRRHFSMYRPSFAAGLKLVP